MKSTTHKGLIISNNCDPGYAVVWLPTGNSTVPDGFSEYLYQNTGGQLYGAELQEVYESSYICKIACPLTSGAWFRASETESASIFDDYNDIPYDYRICTDYQTFGNNGTPASYIFPTDNQMSSGAVSVSTLSVVGGNPTHTVGTMPKGFFPVLQVNQWVLVQFISSDSNPVITQSIHSDAAWRTVQNT